MITIGKADRTIVAQIPVCGVTSDILELMKQGRVHDADHRIAEITGLKKEKFV